MSMTCPVCPQKKMRADAILCKTHWFALHPDLRRKFADEVRKSDGAPRAITRCCIEYARVQGDLDDVLRQLIHAGRDPYRKQTIERWAAPLRARLAEILAQALAL